MEEFVKLNQEIHGGSFGGSDRDAVFEKNTSGKGLNGKSNGEQSIPVAMKMIGETLFPFLFLFFHVGNGSGNGKGGRENEIDITGYRERNNSIGNISITIGNMSNTIGNTDM